MNSNILEDLCSASFFNKAEYVRWLYTNDRVVFGELYVRIEKEIRYRHLLPLLASTLLYNGETFDLAPVRQYMYECLRGGGLKYELKKGFDIIRAVQEGQSPCSDRVFPEADQYSLYSFPYAYQDLAWLYDYDEDCKTYVDFLFLNALYNDCFHDYRNLLGNLLMVQVTCYGKTTSEVIDGLLAGELVTPRMLFYAYAGNLSGHINLLDSQAVEPYVKQYEKEALALFPELMDEEEIIARNWIDMVYRIVGLDDFSPLLPYLYHKEVTLKRRAKKILLENEEKARPKIEEQLEAADKPDTVLLEMLARWDDKQYEASSFFGSDAGLIAFCKEYLDKKMLKKLSWIPAKLFNEIRFKKGKRVPVEVIYYFLQCYFELKDAERLHIGDRIAERFETEGFAGFLSAVYQLWLQGGGDPKYKMIILPYALYGGEEAVRVLAGEVPGLVKAARTAIATLMMKAIGLNGSKEALNAIGYFAVYREWTGAVQALKRMADERNVPVCLLEDETVPRLGFDENGIKRMKYGDFTLTVCLMPDLTLSFIYQNKVLASYNSFVPSACKSRVKEDMAVLKKQLKEVVREQESRLIEILWNGRQWEYSNWLRLFMDHPVVMMFTTKLVWGVYEGETLKTAFTIDEEKRTVRLSGEQFSIPADATVTLVHPMECPEIRQWYKEHVAEDYMKNLLHIIGLPPTVALSEQEVTDKVVKRYEGKTVSQEIDFVGLFRHAYKGSVIFWDTYGIYFRDRFLDIEVLLKTEYLNYAYKVTFFKELVMYRSSFHKEHAFEVVREKDLLSPASVPKRFLNTVLILCDNFVSL